MSLSLYPYTKATQTVNTSRPLPLSSDRCALTGYLHSLCCSTIYPYKDPQKPSTGSLPLCTNLDISYTPQFNRSKTSELEPK